MLLTPDSGNVAPSLQQGRREQSDHRAGEDDPDDEANTRRRRSGRAFSADRAHLTLAFVGRFVDGDGSDRPDVYRYILPMAYFRSFRGSPLITEIVSKGKSERSREKEKVELHEGANEVQVEEERETCTSRSTPRVLHSSGNYIREGHPDIYPSDGKRPRLHVDTWRL